jgi:hypothetical protein
MVWARDGKGQVDIQPVTAWLAEDHYVSPLCVFGGGDGKSEREDE